MQDLCNTLPEYSVVKEMDCIGDTLAPLSLLKSIQKQDFIQKKRQRNRRKTGYAVKNTNLPKCNLFRLIGGLTNSFEFTTARLWSFTPNINCSLRYILIGRLNTSFKRQLCYIVFSFASFLNFVHLCNSYSNRF